MNRFLITGTHNGLPAWVAWNDGWPAFSSPTVQAAVTKTLEGLSEWSEGVIVVRPHSLHAGYRPDLTLQVPAYMAAYKTLTDPVATGDLPY